MHACSRGIVTLAACCSQYAPLMANWQPWKQAGINSIRLQGEGLRCFFLKHLCSQSNLHPKQNFKKKEGTECKVDKTSGSHSQVLTSDSAISERHQWQWWLGKQAVKWTATEVLCVIYSISVFCVIGFIKPHPACRNRIHKLIFLIIFFLATVQKGQVFAEAH